VLGIIAAIVAIVLFFGIRWYRFNENHVSTDDAQVGGDVYSINAKVSGYLTSVPVGTNQFVHKGDLLATIDPSEYQAALQQAQANLNSLKAAAAASGHEVAVTRQTTGAQVSQAAAAEAAANANTAAMTAKKTTAEAGVSAARAALSSAEAGAQAAQHGVAAAQAQVRSAESEYKSAQAALSAALASQHKAEVDEKRYATLRNEGAVSAQMYEGYSMALTAAEAQAQQAGQAVNDAAAHISQAQAAVESAKSQATQADAAVQQARVGVLQAEDQVASSQASIAQAEAQANQAKAALQSAQSAPAQVSVTTSTAASNQAKIAQAEAAVQEAELQLSYTQIRSPADGYVSEKAVEPGQLVQPGEDLMAVVPLNTTYVDANFKETQLSGIKAGEPAEITVDAYPGKVFRGSVESISSATGATFSLLPPENATGNFVKVVQRIPVRIKVDQTSDPQHLLRLGMSVNVTVTTS